MCPTLTGTSDPNNCFAKDFKAIGGGNVWANLAGTEILIVAHSNGGSNYYGWRSFAIETEAGTKFADFWQGGDYEKTSGLCGA